MPSFTFVSTANAFVLRGATPVFVDIRPDTLNMDETTDRGGDHAAHESAIVPVHYAGVGCEMDAIMEIADRHDLFVIEDAAPGAPGQRTGSAAGHASAILRRFSFHETKNIMCGEGGAFLINDERCVDRAEIIREKGTTAGSSSAGRSTSTPGSTSARRTCRARSSPPSSGLRWKMQTPSPLGGWPSGPDITIHLTIWKIAGALRRPIVPPDCPTTTATSTTCCSQVFRHARCSLSGWPQGDSIGFPLRAVACITIWSLDWPDRRRHDAYNNATDCLTRLPLWLGLEPRLDEVIHEVRALA